MRVEMAEGFRYVASEKVVFGLMLVGIIPSLLSMPLRSLMPIFAKDVLDVGSAGLGVLMASTGAGAVTGAILLASLGNFRHKGLLMLSSLVATGFAMMFFSQSQWFYLSLVILLMQGGSEIGYRSMNNTLLQATVPDKMRGRVTSIYMLNQSFAPFGSMVAGIMVAVFGASEVIFLMGMIMAAVALTAAWRLPHMRALT
jgi:hypothetical protein